MTDRQITHAPGCWGWGPRHYECALREIELLVAERDALREALLLARDFVAEALAQERDAYRGHESVSSIADIERYLAQIDAALAQGQGDRNE